MNTLSHLKAKFLQGIKGAFEPYKNADFDAENTKLFKAAVLQGYDDAKRTFTEIGPFWQAEAEKKDQFLTFVASKLQAIVKSTKPFEDDHTKLCNEICQWFSDRNFESVKFGQAQKIVNMAFKYLYCLKGADQYPFFGKCHMPLDSFTLEWYKRFVYQKGNQKITEKIKWSNLKEEEYVRIQESIRKKLTAGTTFFVKGEEVALPSAPLDTEFFIWDEMILHVSAENFLFTIKNMDSKEKNLCKTNANVYDKLKEIQITIDQYINKEG